MNIKRAARRGKITCITVFSIILTFAAVGASHNVQADERGHDQSAAVVLITGANRGLGLEFARQYSNAGWKVIGTARRPEAAGELKKTGAMVLQLDVTDDDSVARLAANLADTPIDMLINNAGILPESGTVDAIEIETIERILDVNTIGPMRVTTALLPNLRAGETKKIINVTSFLGSIEANTSGGFYGYRESKAALNMYSRTLADDLGEEGFICIALHPGWVSTDMGGPEAPLTPPQSVTGMVLVIEKLTAEQNGTFLGWDGEEMPW